MQIKSIVAGAAIVLIAGAGSVLGNELTVAKTTGILGAPFAFLNGTATAQMSDQEMAAVQGSGWRYPLYISDFGYDVGEMQMTSKPDPSPIFSPMPPPAEK
jgi:hypothetical protein